MPIGGKTLFKQNLLNLMNDPQWSNVDTLGIVRDADSLLENDPNIVDTLTAATRSFQSICDTLKHVRLVPPDKHGVWSRGSPKIGVYIVPDGDSDGMLETLCRQSVTSRHESICVDALFQCLNNRKEFSPKAWTHAYIATQKDPDLHMGKAAKKGYWNLLDSCFDHLVEFLRSLQQQ